MKKQSVRRCTELLEKATRRAERQTYVLRLYIAGLTPRAREAIRNVRSLCEEELTGRCDLKVIDLCEHPALAHKEQIVAIPTLIRKLPLPLRHFVGSMIDKEKLLVGLDLRPRSL